MPYLARILPAAGLVWLLAGIAAAEPVTSYEMTRDQKNTPCRLSITNSEGRSITIHIFDKATPVELNFFLEGAAEAYRFYAETNGLIDRDRFAREHKEISIGEETHRLHKASLYETVLDKIDAKTSGHFQILERHNVVAAVQAMQEDGLLIPGLAAFREAGPALAEFRACALQAFGVEEGAVVEVDRLAEIRLIFDDAFRNWVARDARAEGCSRRGAGDAAIAAVIEKAAAAFYPGLFSMSKRNEYREKLEKEVPFARLEGATEAVTGSCLMAEDIATVARIPVDESLRAAREADR